MDTPLPPIGNELLLLTAEENIQQTVDSGGAETKEHFQVNILSCESPSVQTDSHLTSWKIFS